MLWRSLGHDGWDNLPPLVWGLGFAYVTTAVPGAILHLEGFGFDNFLDRANFLTVRVDFGELAGTLQGDSGAIPSVLTGLLLTGVFRTGVLPTGAVLTAVILAVAIAVVADAAAAIVAVGRTVCHDAKCSCVIG